MADTNTPTRWEYFQWVTSVREPGEIVNDERTAYLRMLGADGWELVSTMMMPHIRTAPAVQMTRTTSWVAVYVFKRPYR